MLEYANSNDIHTQIELKASLVSIVDKIDAGIYPPFPREDFA